jgi:hypothetical protein
MLEKKKDGYCQIAVERCQFNLSSKRLLRGEAVTGQQHFMTLLLSTSLLFFSHPHQNLDLSSASLSCSGRLFDYRFDPILRFY